jgi:hypothetical protein
MDVKKKWEELLPTLPVLEYDYTWCDRVRTWEQFQNNGYLLVKLFEQFPNDDIDDEIRNLAPEMFDLIIDTFGKEA